MDYALNRVGEREAVLDKVTPLVCVCGGGGGGVGAGM